MQTGGVYKTFGKDTLLPGTENRFSKMSGATYELCASTIVYGKAKNNFKYSVFCIAISFLNDYVSKYSKAQIKCQQFF